MKQRILAAFVCIASLGYVNAQQLTQFEYFWNTDPGLGNGVLVDIDTPLDEVTTEFNINTNGMNPGRHRLFVRSISDEGVIGTTRSYYVYLTRQLTYTEYFWNVDPGEGNGTILNTVVEGNESEACQSISTASLTAGNHSLYVRTASADGVWSIPYKTTVTITESSIATGCAGDFDRNGSINTTDLLAFLSGYGVVGDCTYDLTSDFTVNTSDILVFLGLFGSSCE